MGYQTLHSSVWALARAQHGVVSRRQLLDAGLSAQGIKRRLANGRLHAVRRGVYAVGRPEISQRGQWMAAVLAGGSGAVLSHSSAASLWGIAPSPTPLIHLTVPAISRRRVAGTRLHRRDLRPSEITAKDGIPVTAPSLVLIDIAAAQPNQLEAAINSADKGDLIGPAALEREVAASPTRPGRATLLAFLSRATFRLTDSGLERRFLRLLRAAGLPTPLTQQMLCGFRVDFHWPDLCLVVETDGLRYHRTPAQQARDQRRDRTLRAAGLTVHRFTHAEVRYEPAYVAEVLRATINSVIRATAIPNAK
jgi:very-short-patch-repair endonuclease